MSDETQQLLAFINRELLADGQQAGPETPLFEEGIIDSLKILQIIGYLEERRGFAIADKEIRMDKFRTPAAMARSFLAHVQ